MQSVSLIVQLTVLRGRGEGVKNADSVSSIPNLASACNSFEKVLTF